MASMLVRAFLFAALAVIATNGVPVNPLMSLPLTIGGHPLFNLNLNLAKQSEKPATSTYEKTFEQNLDQLDSSNKKTWKQRYFKNTQWKSSTNGAVHVLYLEGEMTATPDKVSDVTLPHVALAKELGATAWSLEHRWRGKSQPLPRTFAANYRQYLSTQQAIEDIAVFIKKQNTDSKETKAKWIVVGSNYGGNLALWVRQKYPDLTVGAVADSAPITPSVDFYTYEKYVEEAYSNYSYECWHGIKFSALAIRNEVQYQLGVDRLNNELKLTPPIDDNRVDFKSFQNLHHNLIQLFEVPVVYNKVNVGPFSSCCGIDDVCKIMQNETEKDIERVYLLAKLLYNNIHGSKDAFPGIPNDYELVKKYLNQTKHDSDNTEQPTARSWLWQQCHEFGQFITTDNGRGLFGATVPNDYFIGLCTDAFEEKIYSFTVDNLKSGVRNTTRALKTSRTYTGSNAVIFNGGHDPWNQLGVNKVTHPSTTLITVDGVGHAAVLQAPHKNDPAVLKNARSNGLVAKVKKWVKGTSTSTLAVKKSNKPEMRMPEEVAEQITEKATLTIPTIRNWHAKIEYSEDGLPPKTSPSYAFNIHKDVKKESLLKNHGLVRKSGSFADKMRARSIAAERNGKHFNVTTKKHYLMTGYITQDTDHFVDAGTTFTQRFFKNDLFQRDRDAIRFLMLGAEAAIDYAYVDDDFMQYYRWAKDFKAVIYAIEHRFYGYSTPFSNSSVEVLKRYMTMEQILADAAVFIRATNAADNNTVSPRWVIFGGSYGGNLVAAFRLRYPELSVGGIASSAPLQAKVDFYEYMQKTESDVKKYGPNFCPSAMRRYFGWIRRKFNTRPGRAEIKEAFCISNRWDENYINEKDSELFLANQIIQLGNMIQYDSEKHSYLNYMCRRYKAFDDANGAEKQNRVRKIAQAMAQIQAEIDGKSDEHIRSGNAIIKADDKDDYYEGDKAYDDYDDSDPSRYSDSKSGEPEVLCPATCYYCSKVSYNAMLQNLQNVYRNCWNGAYCSDEGRLWFWISCSTWGFAESTNYGYNYFESSYPINHILDICADVFGDEYNRTKIDEAVRLTNLAYGGSDNYNGTQVMFVNGSEDPWSTLSVYKPLNPKNVTSLLIDGTSHCVDMNREYDHDVQVLKDARKKIKKQIIRWVKRPKGPLQG